MVNGGSSCQCRSTYVGSPPNCRPECTVNSDCSPSQACMREKCRDPCPGSCGSNAQCTVLNHVPICSCFNGYTGDPFSNCYPIPVTPSKKAEDVTFTRICERFDIHMRHVYSPISWTVGKRPLRIIPLWPQCTLWKWNLYMLDRLSGWSICWMPTRVCIEYRLCSKSRLFEKQMRRSLPWYLRSKCRVSSI